MCRHDARHGAIVMTKSVPPPEPLCFLLSEGPPRSSNLYDKCLLPYSHTAISLTSTVLAFNKHLLNTCGVPPAKDLEGQVQKHGGGCLLFQ